MCETPTELDQERLLGLYCRSSVLIMSKAKPQGNKSHMNEAEDVD